MSVLDELAESAFKRTEKEKKLFSISNVRREAEAMPIMPSFMSAIKKDGLSLIAEIKKSSPSKGLIAIDFQYIQIAKEYEKGGSDAISCLTEPTRFLGCDKYLEEISKNVSIPILRKDFIIDEFMIYRSRCIGASAILLIVSLLDDVRLKDYLSLAAELKMDVLVECHDENEIERAITAGAVIIGINNRDLGSFRVDNTTAERLSSYVPDDKILVAESGIKTALEARNASSYADCVLIGEALMKSSDRKAFITEMKNGKNKNMRHKKY